MKKAPFMSTKLAAGVMQTRPAIAPLIMPVSDRRCLDVEVRTRKVKNSYVPKIEGCFLTAHSVIIHIRAEAEVDI